MESGPGRDGLSDIVEKLSRPCNEACIFHSFDMRGDECIQDDLLSNVFLVQGVPQDHPLRSLYADCPCSCFS